MRSLKYLIGAVIFVGAVIILTVAKSSGLISEDIEQWKGIKKDVDRPVQE